MCKNWGYWGYWGAMAQAGKIINFVLGLFLCVNTGVSGVSGVQNQSTNLPVYQSTKPLGLDWGATGVKETTIYG